MINRKVIIAGVTSIITTLMVLVVRHDMTDSFKTQLQFHQTATNQGTQLKFRELDTSKPFVKPCLPRHLQNVNQNDHDLVAHIRRKWIILPSNKPRKLTKPNKINYSENGQSLLVDTILKGRTNGFFVESGAHNGELLSNSLFFEKSKNWSGVLIEVNDRLFKSILVRNRHAYLVNAGLSPERRPMLSSFVRLDHRLDGIGGLISHMSASHLRRMGGLDKHMHEIEQVQCLPLYSILQAVGELHVDYLSLDIEGPELDVLRTLPLDEITIDVISVEYVVGGTNGLTAESQKKLHAITSYLVGKYNYEVVHISKTEDVILKRKGL